MADKQLFDYIEQQLQQGMSKEQIKNSLLSVGWQAQDIDESFNSSTPPSQPLSSPGRYKILKIILGIATFWPIFYIVTFVFIIALAMGVMAATWGFGSRAISALHSLTFLGTLLMQGTVFYSTLILIFVVSLLYIVIVFKNKSISKNNKAIWVAVFFQGILSEMLLLAMAIINSASLQTLLFYMGVFIVTPYIAMPVYWNRYVRKKPQQNKVLENRYQNRSNYTFIVLYIVFFIAIPLILVGPDTYREYLETEDLKKRQLKAFENAQNINAYLPTAFKNNWKPQLNSKSGEVKFEYFGGWRSINLVEIKSPKTDVKCNGETYLELDKIIPEYRPATEKQWLEKCEELSISGGKSVLSESQQRKINQGAAFYENEVLIVFNKENTRIFLHYKEKFLEDSAPELSRSDLIRMAENLKPIKLNSVDFKP